MEAVATHLTQGYTITAISVQEAINLQAANARISDRDGRTVTFRRSSWMRHMGTKPKPKADPKPVVPFEASFR